jgi:hypothetical protein
MSHAVDTKPKRRLDRTSSEFVPALLGVSRLKGPGRGGFSGICANSLREKKQTAVIYRLSRLVVAVVVVVVVLVVVVVSDVEDLFSSGDSAGRARV